MLKKIWCLIILINFVYFEALALPVQSKEEYSDESFDLQDLLDDGDYSEYSESVSDESYDRNLLNDEMQPERVRIIILDVGYIESAFYCCRKFNYYYKVFKSAQS